MFKSSATLWKAFAFFPLLALIGVYLFYRWYDETLYRQLAKQDAERVQLTARLADTVTQLQQTQAAQAQAQAEILALQKRNQEAKAGLANQLGALAQTKTTLDRQLETLQTALLDERRKATEAIGERDNLVAAHAELERLYEADKVKTITLQMDLDRIHQVIADTTAEHQARVAKLEQHLNERIALAKTTPMDASLLCVAQTAGVLPPQERAAQEQALTERLGEAQSRLDALQSERDTARGQLAEMQQRLEQTQTELAQVQDRLAAAANETNAGQARELAAAEQLAELRSQCAGNDRTEELAILNRQLEDERQVRAQLLQQHQEALTALTEKDDESQRMLAAVESELRAAQRQNETPDPVLSAQSAAASARIALLETALETERRQAAAAVQTVGEETAQSCAKLRELYAGFAELGGTFTTRGLLLRLSESELHFPPGQAILPTGELASLNRIATLLAEQPDLTVRIEGHTDRLGGDELNLPLSRQRAEAVRQALIARGVDAARLTAEGIGAARPIADNGAAAGRSQNRRVEIYVEE